jgi:hypothetical protein
VAGCSSTDAGHGSKPALPAVERALPASADLQRVLGVTVEVGGLTQVGRLTAQLFAGAVHLVRCPKSSPQAHWQFSIFE